MAIGFLMMAIMAIMRAIMMAAMAITGNTMASTGHCDYVAIFFTIVNVRSVRTLRYIQSTVLQYSLFYGGQ